MSQPDAELIADSLRGQTEAFGALVLRYQNRLFNSLVGMLGSAEDARDVAQDAFVQAFQKLHTFRGQSAFYSWLFRIALNTAASHQRKRHRSLVSIDAVREQTGQELPDLHPETRPGFGLEATERQAAVRLALTEMTEEFRTVLVLKEIDGLRYEEIAEIVDCPIGTVRSRIHRARIELRHRLTHIMKETPEV